MSFLAYALIWAFFLAVPIARGVVSAQFGRMPSAMGRRVWLGMVCGSVLVIVNGLVLVLLGTHARAGTWGAGAAGLLLNLGWAITVATTEEMIVRGLLLTRLRQLWGDLAAIAVTAAVFAGMHVGRADFTVSGVLQYLADGLLLGWLAVRTGDIWAGAGFHFAKNLGVSVLFGGSKHLLSPALVLVPGGHGWRPDLADLVAYAVAIPLCIALFRRSSLRHGKQ